MTDFSKTKIHCSALSNVMTTDRKKSNMQQWREACAEIERKEALYDRLKKKDGPMGIRLENEVEELRLIIPKLESVKDIEEPLSVTCKSYLSTVYVWQKYGKWSISREIGNKATEKGKEVEPESIRLVSRLEDKKFEKNGFRLENDWFTGIPDFFEGESIVKAEKVHDVKSPWDLESFISYVGKPLSPQYYWQMQGYMDLTGASVAEVHFCLVSALDYQILAEFQRLCRSAKIIDTSSPDAQRLLKDVQTNLTFEDVPLKDRRIKFIIERNDEDIQLAHERVEKCREYLQEFEKLHTEYDFTTSTKKIDLDEAISA